MSRKSPSLDKSPLPIPGERWKAHPQWPFYVSTAGRVRSQKTGRLVGFREQGTTVRGAAGGTSRVGVVNTKDCVAVTVSNAPKTNVKVHVLVLETFVGPRPPDHDGDHIDHDRMNNRLNNLRWRLAAYNRADTKRAA